MQELPTVTERRVVFALVAALGLLYLPGLTGQVLDWDDEIWLNDPALQSPSLAWTTTRDRVYAPLLRLSFAAQHAVFGQNVWLWHAFHLAMFLGLVAGTWAVLRRFGVPRTPALAAIALWAFHPTKVECVAWLTGAVKDLQSGLFVVGAALVAASGGSAWTVAALMLCAGLTKAAIFPLAFVIFAGVAIREGWRVALQRVGPACGVAVAVAVVGAIAWTPSELDQSVVDRVVRAGWVHGTFWTKLFSVGLPSAITPLASSPWPATFIGIVLTGTFAGVAARDHRYVPPLILWIAPQIPFLGTVDLGFWAADRYLLFASLGVALALGYALERASAVPYLLAAVLVVPTAMRVPEWHSSLSLWEAEGARPGQHPARSFKLGMAYAKVGRFTEALTAFEHAHTLDPEDDVTLARLLIGSLAADGDWTRQDFAASQALEPVPTSTAAWKRAANALTAAGRADLAARASERADRMHRDAE